VQGTAGGWSPPACPCWLWTGPGHGAPGGDDLPDHVRLLHGAPGPAPGRFQLTGASGPARPLPAGALAGFRRGLACLGRAGSGGAAGCW
jgi:hypothetical protein